MTLLRSSLGTGRYVASEDDLFIARSPVFRGGGGTAPGVIFCLGGDGTAESPRDYTNHLGELRLIDALAEEGFAVVAADLGGTFTFGNDLSQTRFGQAKTYLQGTRGAKAGPVLAVGLSMGAQTALVYAKANPTHIEAVAAAIPVLDPNDIVVQNRNNSRHLVHLAYGARTDTNCTRTSGSAIVSDSSAVSGDVGKPVSGTGIPLAVINSVVPGVSFTMSANATSSGSGATVYVGGYVQATHGATKNPVTFASSLAVPVGLWTASNDTICVPATADAFVAAYPATVRTNVGALDHSQDAILAAVDGIVAFCLANSP